jgi:hypothetical protein
MLEVKHVPSKVPWHQAWLFALWTKLHILKNWSNGPRLAIASESGRAPSGSERSLVPVAGLGCTRWLLEPSMNLWCLHTMHCQARQSRPFLSSGSWSAPLRSDWGLCLRCGDRPTRGQSKRATSVDHPPWCEWGSWRVTSSSGLPSMVRQPMDETDQSCQSQCQHSLRAVPNNLRSRTPKPPSYKGS